MSLHVFRNEANEWFVAESADDATTLWLAEFGMEDPDDEYAFTQWPDDKSLIVCEEGEPESAETHTGAEWAEKTGRGFFFAGEP